MPWNDELITKTLDYLNHYHCINGQSHWINHPMRRGSYFFRENWLRLYGLTHYPAFHFFINNYTHQNGLVCTVRLESQQMIAHNIHPPNQILELFNGIIPEHFVGQGEAKNIGYTTIWRLREFNPLDEAAQLPVKIWHAILKDFILQPEVQQFINLD